jgi:all-trans-retinol dehydrogenase (NAD+)
MTKYFLEVMIEQNSGHIVSISSMAGLHPSHNIIQYSATKFGLNGLMAALNEHLRMKKLSAHIKTTCVFPYYIKTRPEIEEFMNPNFHMPPLDIEYAAKEVVNGILREDIVTVIPKFLEAIKFLKVLPIKIQQLFHDRVLREHKLKNKKYA